METLNNKKVVCTDRNGEKFEIDAHQLKFRPSVYGIVIRENKILLAKQWDGYDFPGGGVNLGERVSEALVREYREETGYDVKPEKLLACVDDFHKMSFTDGFVQSILIYYSCRIIGGQLSKANFDADQFEDKYMDLAEWIDLENIENVKFYNPIRDVKAQILNNLKNGNEAG